VNDRSIHFRSPLFDELAQLLILYERVRMEAFAATTSAEGMKAVAAPGGSVGTRDSFGRCLAAQSEFAEALLKLSQTGEFRTAERKSDGDSEMKNLFEMVSKASRYFRARQAFAYQAVVHGAGSFTASEFAATSAEETICIIRDGFTQATQAMHALVAAFICDRF
jgi:hypothetical protein